MDTGTIGSTKAKCTIQYSKLLDDRLRAITVRLNMSMREVLLRLIIAGLDATQDLALTEPASRDGLARYDR